MSQAIEAAATMITLERVIADSGLELTDRQRDQAVDAAAVKHEYAGLGDARTVKIYNTIAEGDEKILKGHGLTPGNARILLRDIIAGSTGMKCTIFDLPDGSYWNLIRQIKEKMRLA